MNLYQKKNQNGHSKGGNELPKEIGEAKSRGPNNCNLGPEFCVGPKTENRIILDTQQSIIEKLCVRMNLYQNIGGLKIVIGPRILCGTKDRKQKYQEIGEGKSRRPENSCLGPEFSVGPKN